MNEIFLKHGFPASAWISWEKSKDLYQEHAIRYQKWIDDKNHAGMGYLERGLDFRLQPEKFFPELKSVITVLLPYSKVQPQSDFGLKYARYLNGPDYHTELKQKLQDLLDELRMQGHLGAEAKTKICVDTSAVLERSWASISGLGWIGKNTMLIHPKLGSFFFIGVVFTDQSVEAGPMIQPDYCGHCNRCVEGCPTDAIQNHQIISEKCISYRTLEKKEEYSGVQNHAGYVAGCDICQEVCPFNQKSLSIITEQEHSNFLNLKTEELFSESLESYKNRVKSHALSHVKPERFDRNLRTFLVQALKEKEVSFEVAQALISKRIQVLKGSDLGKDLVQKWTEIQSFSNAPE